MRTGVYPLLFGDTDIYAGMVADPAAEPPDGWNDHSGHFARLASEARLIVEVGSWLGRSAIALANAALQAEVVCLDTWLGAREMWENHGDPSRYGKLRHVHGYPTLYYEFLQNIVNAGKESQVTPMPMPSSIGLRLLHERKIHPDLIYVDGSHEEIDVRRDIEDCLSLRPKILCGDDYGLWPGVTNAVNAMLPDAVVYQHFWYSAYP